MSSPPNLVTERDFWRDPVQVFTGLTFFVVGLVVGAVAFAVLYH